MGSDMVVVLSQASVDGQAFFGHNSNRPAGEPQSLVRTPGKTHAPDEVVQTGQVRLPQVRQSWTVLASRAGQQWGYQSGVNERGLAVARTPLQSRLQGGPAGLTGPDLVRLLLERCSSTCQAEELAVDLLSHHGHGSPAESSQGEALLIADAGEACILAVCGPWWVIQEVEGVRTLNEAGGLRQGWHRIAPGLADQAIAQGWWPGDGSKLDFEQALDLEGARDPGCLRRQRRARQLLEQQNGRFDLLFLRRVLADHFEDADDSPEREPGLCRHGCQPSELATAVSLAARLNPPPASPRVVWWAFGPPCTSVYFPILFEAELPAAFQHEKAPVCSVWQRLRQLQQRAAGDPRQRWAVREALTALQLQFDQDTGELIREAGQLASQGQTSEIGRLASSFQQHNLERFEDLCRHLLHDARQPQRHRMAVRVQELLSQAREL